MADDSHLVTWGTPRHAPHVGGVVGAFLTENVGRAEPWPIVPARPLPPCRLGDDVLDAMRAVVGPDYVATDEGARLAATGGASYLDWVRHRGGDRSASPDAVVRPADEHDVVSLLAVAERHGVVVAPVGGGTSVVGGLRERRPHIALVLDRLGGLIDLDSTSAIAVVGPAITGPRLEPLLAARGFTLGHLPQSWARATIGGYVATRSAGQASTGYGRIDDMVEALSVATPRGVVRLGRGPSSAAGPDLRGVFVGSEGVYGVITEVALRVRRLPTARRYEAVVFPDFAHGVEAFRACAQSGVLADVMRLSDAAETRTSLALSGPTGRKAAALERYLGLRRIDVSRASLAILGWEGTDGDFVADRRRATWRAMRSHGAVSLGRGAGESWRRGRFDGPFLRDALMDAGFLVETLETATHWGDYGALHRDLTTALREAIPARPGPYVMSHLSHVYETGGSLYTTVIAVADQRDPISQWQRAKDAAMSVIVDRGATITHHHAVGRDHAPWLAAESGALSMDVLRAIKREVDPHDVLNPGVLLADGEP